MRTCVGVIRALRTLVFRSVAHLRENGPLVLGLGGLFVLGVGARQGLEEHWPQPSTTVSRFTSLPLDRYVTIVEGAGKINESK
jgi:hypothetical protein